MREIDSFEPAPYLGDDVRRLFASMLCLSTVLAASPASAAALDLDLVGLGVPARDGGAPERFRLLSTELAFALSPRSVAPAETLGISGFEIGADVAIIGFHTERDYWQNVTEQQRFGGAVPAGTQAVTGIHFRKGLPFSFELEGHLNYLINSSMFLLGGALRYSFLEGYKYVPNIAVRAGVGRLMNAADIDMTLLHVDATLSKTFPIGGVMTLTPMLGWGMLLINANSSVLDATPLDQSDNRDIGSNGSLYTMPEYGLGANIHQRVFAGLRLKTFVFSFYYQFDAGLISNGPPLLQNTLKLALDF